MTRVSTFPFLVLITVVLLACDGPTSVGQSRPPTATELDELRRSPTTHLSPEEVAETFALGGDFTDVQRDVLTKELVGSVVEWNIHVYNVEHSGGAYDVLSQPFPVRSPDAINVLRASLRVYPQSARDREVLLAAKTNDAIRVRGLVQAVSFRAIVFVAPAVLVPETGEHS